MTVPLRHAPADSAIVRATGLAYVAFTAPDLGRTRDFLLDFGMTEAPHGSGLFMTGGRSPFLYRAREGAPGFDGFAFEVADLDALRALALATERPMESLDGPGGGMVVSLVDPDGYRVDAVAGRAVRATPPAPEQAWNSQARRTRIDAVKRVPTGPAHVQRLGHVVLGVSDFARSEAWYKARFGLLTSDAIEAEGGGLMGAFLRCDLDDVPTDHHTLFLAQALSVGFRHAAFEVADLDDLMAGHWRLKAQGHRGVWGVGRHVLGSQVFDYWRDPWGHMLEHWTDGDLFTRKDAPRVAPAWELHEVQWGPVFPAQEFTNREPSR